MREKSEKSEDSQLPERRARFDRYSHKYRARARKFVRIKMKAALRKYYDSEDVLQDALLTTSRLLLRNEDGFDEARFYSCLKTVVENRIKVLLRFVMAEKRNPGREEYIPRDGVQLPIGDGKTPSEELSLTEQAERLRRAIQRLSPRARDVITLVHLQKLRVSEAAKRLKKTPNATSVLLCEALSELREILRGKGD